jgi:hypothetical protein
MNVASQKLRSYVNTSGYPWPLDTVKSPGFFKPRETHTKAQSSYFYFYFYLFFVTKIRWKVPHEWMLHHKNWDLMLIFNKNTFFVLFCFVLWVSLESLFLMLFIFYYLSFHCTFWTCEKTYIHCQLWVFFSSYFVEPFLSLDSSISIWDLNFIGGLPRRPKLSLWSIQPLVSKV